MTDTTGNGDTTTKTPDPKGFNDLLDQLGFDNEVLSILAEHPEEFIATGTTIQLRKGTTTSFPVNLGGTEVEGQARLNSAFLQRATRMTHHVAADDRDTLMATGIIRPIHFDLSLVADTTAYRIEEFITGMVNKSREQAQRDPLSVDTMLATLAKMGLPLQPVDDMGVGYGMSMAWQHFGCDAENMERLFEVLSSCGATDATPDPEKAGRIEQVLALPNSALQAIEVVAFDVTKQNRDRSRYYEREIEVDGETQIFQGTGFEDLITGVIENFKRGMSLRKTRAQLKEALKQFRSDPNHDKDEAEEMRKQIQLVTQMATRWMNNYGGAQRRIVEQPDGALKYLDIFDPVQVPVGSMTLVVNGNEDDPIEINLWSDNRGAGSGTAPTGVVDTTGEAEDEEDEVDAIATDF